LAKGRLRPKIPALREALTHRFRLEHHGALIAQMLAHIDFLESIAVGTALTGGPPRRSQRAGLPHWAPASGSGVEAHGR
jgi:hypothetical protein